MELMIILGLLRRYWLLLVPGAFVALLAGIAAIDHISLKSPHLTSRGTANGVAVGQSLVTSREAPTFQLSSRSYVAQILPARALMLANLMATDEQRAEIARRAGVDAEQLAVFGPSSHTTMVRVPIATEATAAALAVGGERYRLLLGTAATPPLITVQAVAPDPVVAVKLVQAVRETLAQVLTAGDGARRSVGAPSRSGPRARAWPSTSARRRSR